jgi:hypothetical protein
MKHNPFQSIYRQDFEVVEERQGKLRLYPHTQQLPLLLRALNLEFYGALPGHIARTDKRGDGFHKVLLKSAGLLYCNLINGGRPDGMRLMSLPDADLASRVCIAQQVTEDSRQGAVHWFKFYGGPDFFQELRLSGRRVAFTDHVLQRFSMRVPNRVGEDLSWLLLAIFGSAQIALPVGAHYALVVPYLDSVLAFPFKMDEDEFLLVSCLTVKEMNSVEVQFPPLTFNLHYGETFTTPRVRHWLPTKVMLDLHGKWERKVPPPPPRGPNQKRMTWHWLANFVKDNEVGKGHGPGTQLFFWDHVPGPNTVEYTPGTPEARVDELEFYRKNEPGRDWETVFARREEFIRNPPRPDEPAGKAA